MANFNELRGMTENAPMDKAKKSIPASVPKETTDVVNATLTDVLKEPTKVAPKIEKPVLPTKEEAAADRQSQAKLQLNRLTTSLEEKQKNYDAELAKLDKKGDASFVDKLLTEGGIATGLAALVAAATGHGDLAAGMVLGGLSGTADAVKTQNTRDDDRRKLLMDASFMAGQEAMKGLLGESDMDAQGIRQKVGLDAEMERLNADFAHSTALTKLQQVFNVTNQDDQQAHLSSESGYDRAFRGKEAILQRAHETIMQGAHQDWAAMESDFERVARKELQLNDIDTQKYLQSMHQTFEERKYLFGASHEITMAEVEKNVAKELKKYDYDLQEQAAIGGYWRKLALDNPELAFALADAQGMDTTAMWGVERASILAKSAKQFRIDGEESRILQAMFAESIENGDASTAAGIMSTLGYEGVTSDLLKEMVTGKDARQQEDFFYSHIDGMMTNMTMDSRLKVMKHLADPVNAGDFLGALQLGEPAYDPIAKNAADSTKRQELVSKVFMDYYNLDMEGRLEAQKSLTEFVNNSFGQENAGFMGETGGMDYILANLGSDEYNMGASERAVIATEWQTLNPEKWSKMTPEQRDTRVVRTFLERHESKRRQLVAENIKTTVSYVEATQKRVEKETGVNVNSDLLAQLTFRVMQGPNAPTSEAGANAIVDRIANEAIRLGNEKHLSATDRAVGFVSSMFAFGLVDKDTKGNILDSNPLKYLFGRQVDVTELMIKLADEGY